MSEITKQLIINFSSILTSLIVIFLIKKNTSINKFIRKVFGIDKIQYKQLDYYKSKMSFNFINIISVTAYYAWQFFIIYLLAMSLFYYDSGLLIGSLVTFLIVPIIYRINMSFQLLIHKKR